MIELNADSCEIRVYVQRSGLLKRLGHDLELRAGELHGEIDPAAREVRLEVVASSLRVVSAVERRERKALLSQADAEQIESNLRDRVLETKRYARIAFRSTAVATTAQGYALRGILNLHGREREIAFDATRHDARLEGEVSLNQPDFGIEPFRALGGTLRLEAAVAVVFSLPDPTT